jgi:hypothetical protein
MSAINLYGIKAATNINENGFMSLYDLRTEAQALPASWRSGS